VCEGRIFKNKYKPAGIVMNVKAVIYFRFNLRLKFEIINISSIKVNLHTGL
jgi:hypothetical protein